MRGRGAGACTVVLSSLALGGCATGYPTHSSFAETFQASRYVAVMPPSVGLDWREAGWLALPDERGLAYDNVVVALEEELARRGLGVAWVVPEPDTADGIAEVMRAFRDLLPVLDAPPAEISRDRPALLEGGGTVAEAFGGDLLLLVQTGDQTRRERNAFHGYENLVGIGTRVTIVGLDDAVLLSRIRGQAGSLTDADAARAAMAGVLADLPEVRSPISGPAEDDASLEARAVRQERAWATLVERSRKVRAGRGR